MSTSLVPDDEDIDPEMLKLLKAMDLFSVGCVIAELFMDGEHLFDLSALLKYKTGEYDPNVRYNSSYTTAQIKACGDALNSLRSENSLYFCV